VYRIEINQLDLRQFEVGIVGRKQFFPWTAVTIAPNAERFLLFLE